MPVMFSRRFWCTLYFTDDNPWNWVYIITEAIDVADVLRKFENDVDYPEFPEAFSALRKIVFDDGRTFDSDDIQKIQEKTKKQLFEGLSLYPL